VICYSFSHERISSIVLRNVISGKEKGMEQFVAINKAVNGFVWGPVMLALLVGTGVYLSVAVGFIQFSKIGYWWKNTIGKIFKKGEAGDGEITPLQAVSTALASTVGTGNIAGVTGAIVLGGPGAVFWMWLSALFGMVTKFSEVTLAVKYRERNEKGDWCGGPMYYIKNGLKKHWHWLAYLFSALGVLTVFGTGNATQVNTITAALDSALINYNIISADSTHMINLIIGIIIMILIALIMIGGIKRIGRVTEKLIPFMAVLYIILAIGVVLVNINNVPAVFKSIFQGAFSPASVTGGAVGSFFMSMKKGVSRGIFSNEAGLGTGSIAHACADTSKPVKQGFFGIFEVFVDTIVICTLTALVILCSGVPVGYGQAAGAELTISGFTSTYGGWVSIFSAVAMCCFAFSTVIGWGLYGQRCIEFLLGPKATKPFMAAYSLVAVVGATMNLGLMWSIAETFNGLMVIPNLIAVFLLSNTVVQLLKDYFNGEGKIK
jgi:AGCS family alanine or glycine:cation symporter